MTGKGIGAIGAVGPWVLAVVLSGCIVIPLPESAVGKVPFAIPLRLGGGPATAPAGPVPAPRCAPADGTERFAAATLAAANRQRAAQGLGPLRRVARLDVAAQDQACDIAARQKVGHRGPDGRGLTRRVGDAGYGWSFVAENTGLGDQPERAFDLWMASPGHRANLLNPRVTEAGFGLALAIGGQAGWGMVVAAPR